VRARLLAAAALAASLLLVACGDADDDEPPVVQEEGGGAGQLENPDASVPEVEAVSGMPDPCSLVTEAEVAEAAGAEPTRTVRTQLTPTSAECAFLDDADPIAIVGVELEPEDDLSRYEDLEGEPVDGVGDDAVWSPLLGAVAVLQDGQQVSATLVISDQDPDDLREPATQLAEAALGRL
jgi:hypothetical protein